MMNEQEKRDKLYKIVTSQARIGIFFIIGHAKKKNLTITEVHEMLCDFGKKYDYKNTYKHLMIIKDMGFICLKEQKHVQGKPRIIEIVDIEIFKMFSNLLKNLINDEKFIKFITEYKFEENSK